MLLSYSQTKHSALTKQPPWFYLCSCRPKNRSVFMKHFQNMLFDQTGYLVCILQCAGLMQVHEPSSLRNTSLPHPTQCCLSCCYLPCLPRSLQILKRLLRWQIFSTDVQCVLTCRAFIQCWSASLRTVVTLFCEVAILVSLFGVFA